MAELRDFIGIPYVSHGTDFTGVDCWSLCVLFNKEMLGKTLPSFADLYKNGLNYRDAAKAFTVGVPKFDRVDNPQFGDVILFRGRGIICHAGVWLDGHDFLHIREGQTSTIEPMASSHYADRTEGVIRWKS